MKQNVVETIRFELEAEGMASLSPKEARRVSDWKVWGSAPRLTDPDEYVRMVRRVAASRGRDDVLREDNRLLEVGVNVWSPTVMVERHEEWANFWNKTQIRPEVVGSLYNGDPKDVFMVWLALKTPSGVSVWRRERRWIDGKRMWMVARILLRQGKKSQAMEVLKHPWLANLKLGDTVRALRLKRASQRAFALLGRAVVDWWKSPSWTDPVLIDWEVVRGFATNPPPEGATGPAVPQWWHWHRFVPGDAVRWVVPRCRVRGFQKRAYFNLCKKKGVVQGDEGAATRAIIARGVSVFGRDIYSWLDLTRKEAESIDDALGFFEDKEISTDAAREILTLKRRGMRLEEIKELFELLPQGAGRLDVLDAVEAAKMAAKLGDGEAVSRLTAIGLKFGYAPTELAVIEMRAKRPRPPKNLPGVDVLGKSGFRARLLPMDDPRGLFLGDYTGCCQHPGGAGETAAWHGWESPDGGFYVFESPAGRIEAEAWAWRKGDVIVLDSIEARGRDAGAKRLLQIADALKALTKAILSGSNVIEVRVGLETGIGKQLMKHVASTTPHQPIFPPKGVYSNFLPQVIIGRKEVEHGA